VACNAQEFFNLREMEEDNGQSMDLAISVYNVLVTLQATPTLFKNFINFIAIKFEELASLVVPIIISHTKVYM
jgi:hypothetical protein